MNHLINVVLAVMGSVIVFAVNPAIAENHERNVIPSWGDVVIVHGRGTDAAMDSPEAVRNIIRHWQGRGFTGVYLRTDLAQMDPNQLIRNDLKNQENARLAVIWKHVDNIMEQFDVHATMQKEADAVGFKYWAYHPHLFSDGAPENVGIPGIGRMVPWSYCVKYTYDHPEVISIDRKGNRLWMIREYAYPGARKSKIDEFVYMARKFGLKRFVPCSRSEVLQILPAPDKADQYGFNEPIVADMNRIYNVDIMTDPRFDAFSPAHDPCDPMVQNWYDLRGGYFTQFLRELRIELRKVDPKIQIAMPISGDHVGPPMGNWRLDWRTWVKEGLVDAIICPASFEATIDKDAASKGYITNVVEGKGLIPLSVISDYIRLSKHPEIKVIATSAPAYFYPPPPDKADGWRCDLWYDLYTLAWYQRWEQWKKDLADFGHIKFIAQDFDKFPVRGTGASGGFGDGWYSPKTRACIGCWYKLGDGTDERPIIQEHVKHGASGNAIKLTSSVPGKGALIGWHASAPDRSNYTDCLDNAITNGKVSVEFWLYRENARSSIAVYFQGDDYETDVGLRVTPNSGKISYSKGGKWIESSYALEPQKWQKFTIALDCDRQKYSAFIGTDEPKQLCEDIKYSVPKSRHVVMHGVEHQPIAVPAYRAFKLVQFVPDGSAGNVNYIDDVLVKWQPSLYYTLPGKILLADNFESHPTGSGINNVNGETGQKWELASDQPDNFRIENGTSYGPGVKCLRAQGGIELTAGKNSAIAVSRDHVITLDFDIFIRSNESYPYIIPNPATRSDHNTTIALRTDSNDVLAALQAGHGTWLCYDGKKYADSNTPVAYDVWNHVQMAIDMSSGVFHVVVQPLGELPKLAVNSKLDPVASSQKIYLSINPSKSAGGFSCYDNIAVSCKPSLKCTASKQK